MILHSMQADIPTFDGLICHLNLAKNYRGGERQMELLIRQLAARGWSQRLIVRRGHELRERCAGVPGLEIVQVASNPFAAGLAVRGSRVAHAHEARTVYSALAARLFFGVPYLLTRRVVASQGASPIRALAYRKARHVVSISEAVCSKVSERYPSIKQTIIPDAVAGFESNPDTVAAIRGRFRDKILIGNVGALVHSHKGQSTIIEAARIAATRHPDWQFLICGDGRDAARFSKEIGDLGNVELVGWVDNVGDYLAAFDVFLYPSLHEALGSTLLDAMHFGLPIVASNVDGIPGIVEDGKNGYLITPERPNEIVAAVVRLLSDRGSLDTMRERNKAKAGDFNVSSMADAYEKLYRSAQLQ